MYKAYLKNNIITQFGNFEEYGRGIYNSMQYVKVLFPFNKIK